MIYVCVPVKNHATTVGLLLWKIRQVFGRTMREYQLLVADDESSDETPEVLQRYRRALPMTLVRPAAPGMAAACAALLEEAIRRSDRLKRDAAVLIPADFRVSPDGIPELVRRIESGADLVVAETPSAGLPWSWRLLRRATPLLLRPGVRIPGIQDLFSGCLAVRLATARGLLREGAAQPAIETDGPAAHAELVARLAGAARQTVAAPLPGARHPLPPSRSALALALRLRRVGRELQARAGPPASPEPPRAAPVQSRAS
jgi:glycosyltransferase involved in cell wall biosynthesis